MYWNSIIKFVRFHLLAFISALLLLSLTLLIFWETYEKVVERNRNLFELRTETAKAAIEKRMQDYIQILKGAQGLFIISDTVTLEEWRTYVQILDIADNYPGIQGIGYTSFIRSQELPAFEARMQSSGFTDFRVWPRGKRRVYSSIIYLEPFDERNQRAFGYDMFSDSTRREAMQIAMDTGKPTLSGMVTLVQETDTAVQKGFLLYLPVYSNDIPPQSVEERRVSITGFVYNPFRINDLMNSILKSRFVDLDIEVYDGPYVANSTLLFDKNTNDTYEKTSAPDLTKLIPLQLGEHTWLLYFAALPGFGYETAFPYFVLGGGTLVSMLIFIIMFSFANVKRSTYLNKVITDNATAALFILDTNDYCNFMNPAGKDLTGYTFEEIRQNTLHSMVHHSYPDGSPYPAAACPIIHALSDKGVLHNHESIFIHKNGHQIPVNINAQPIYQHGRTIGYLLEVRDITQEKNAEIALRKKNRNLQTLNNIGKNLSAELALQKLLQLVTDSCTELTGAESGAFFHNPSNEKGESYKLYTLSGAAPKAPSDFPMPRNTKIFSHTFHGEGIIRSDDITKDPKYAHNVPYHDLTGELITTRSYLAVPVISRNGEVLGGLFFGHSKKGVFNENTEEIVKGIAAQAAIAIDNSKLFEALSAKNKELTRINNDLDNFVYTASHDLKAPMLNIEGLIAALKTSLEEEKTEQINRIIGMMKVSVLKFRETIQALTEVARTNKTLDEKVEVIDLQELVNDVQISINDMIQDTDACLKTDLECPEIKFSKSNLKSVLLNLITNAIKYRSPAHPPIIHIVCKRKSDKIILKISDNGMGIPENYLPKMFMMFTRYHSHIEGTGVGLYLVKRIVENSGGTITVQSEVDQGTTFNITLPEL